MTILYEGMLEVIIPVLGSVLTAAVTAGIAAIARYFMRRTKSQTLRDYIDLLHGIVSDTVSSLMQTEVKALKEASADGKLDPEDVQCLKKLAIRTIKADASDGILRFLEKCNVDLDNYLDTLIEAEVGLQKSYK
jgi:hypothetical protein